jgi:molybdate transport system substrate-binding protein
MPSVPVAAFALLLWTVSPPQSGALLVSAALSLTEALSECGAAFEARTGHPVTFNFGPSNVLARQIINGAPVDLFVSADELQLDLVARAGALLPAPRVAVASNVLVVVTRADGSGKWTDPRTLASPRIRRIAVGDPHAVPAGVYARQWLERIGLWATLNDKLVPTHSVRGALSAVANGAADAGIVYRTDARSSPKVSVAYEVTGEMAPAIVYPAAVPRQSRNRETARLFVDFLRGPEGRQIMAARGFSPPPA